MKQPSISSFTIQRLGLSLCDQRWDANNPAFFEWMGLERH